VLRALPGRIGWLLEWIGDAIGIVCCLYFVWYGARFAMASWANGSLSIKTLVLPEWPLLVPMPIAFALLAVEFVFRMHRLARAVPDEGEAAHDADRVADPFEQPADAAGQGAQNDIDADVLALAQQRRRGEQRDQVEDILAELVAGWNAAEAEIAQQHVGADHQRHHQQQPAREREHRLEQAVIDPGKREHESRLLQRLRSLSPQGRGSG